MGISICVSFPVPVRPFITDVYPGKQMPDFGKYGKHFSLKPEKVKAIK